MWSMADRDCWLKVIAEYKAHRLLWDRDDKSYNERSKRSAAYDELVKIAQTIYPNADIAFVKTRLNAFRNCYKRELKKVRAAKANGTTYEPSLFYFNALRFLDPDDDFEDFKWDNNFSDEDDPIGGVKITNEAEPEPELEFEPETEPELQHKSEEHIRLSYKRKSQPRQSQNEMKFEMETGDMLDFEEIDDTESFTKSKRSKCDDDEYTLFGQRIATHLRKMDQKQSLIAEKIISEVCVNGRLKSLTMRSYVKIVPSLPHKSSERNNSLRKDDDDDVYDDSIEF